MTIILICGGIAPCSGAAAWLRRSGFPSLSASANNMYVCLCNGVTEREIRQIAADGCRSMSELTMRTGCGAGCGSCVPLATELLDEVQATQARLRDDHATVVSHSRCVPQETQVAHAA